MLDWLLLILVFLLSGIPLYFAAKLLGGKTGILKAALTVFISGIVFSVIVGLQFPLSFVVAFVLLIWIYREVFRLKWWKAFVVWILHMIFLFVFLFILALFTFSFV